MYDLAVMLFISRRTTSKNIDEMGNVLFTFMMLQITLNCTACMARVVPLLRKRSFTNYVALTTVGGQKNQTLGEQPLT